MLVGRAHLENNQPPSLRMDLATLDEKKQKGREPLSERLVRAFPCTDEGL